MAETEPLPRGLERYALGEKLEGEPTRWLATDRDRARDVVVTRVAFGPSRSAERDERVTRAKALFAVNAPALVATYHAGPWGDDAFVVEERRIEPEPLGARELDPRERALAARAIAEGIATLHAAGWSLDELDVQMDAYRQPKIAAALHTLPRTAESEARDLAEVRAALTRLGIDAPDAASAAALAAAIAVPVAGPSTPLLHAEKPAGRAGAAWVAVALALLLALALFVMSRGG